MCLTLRLSAYADAVSSDSFIPLGVDTYGKCCILCNSQIRYSIDPCQWMNDNGDEEGTFGELHWQKEDTAEVRLTILIKI